MRQGDPDSDVKLALVRQQGSLYVLLDYEGLRANRWLVQPGWRHKRGRVRLGWRLGSRRDSSCRLWLLSFLNCRHGGIWLQTGLLIGQRWRLGLLRSHIPSGRLQLRRLRGSLKPVALLLIERT